MVFRFAIERINTDPTILPNSKLVAQVEKIGKEDSFHADKKGLLLNKNTVFVYQMRVYLFCKSFVT